MNRSEKGEEIRAKLAAQPATDVRVALERFLSAPTIDRAIVEIRATLLPAVARGDVEWCEEFIGRIPSGIPNDVAYMVHIVTAPEARRLHNARAKLAVRLTNTDPPLVRLLGALP